jgi:hypothetical protein
VRNINLHPLFPCNDSKEEEEEEEEEESES